MQLACACLAGPGHLGSELCCVRACELVLRGRGRTCAQPRNPPPPREERCTLHGVPGNACMHASKPLAPDQAGKGRAQLACLACVRHAAGFRARDACAWALVLPHLPHMHVIEAAAQAHCPPPWRMLTAAAVFTVCTPTAYVLPPCTAAAAACAHACRAEGNWLRCYTPFLAAARSSKRAFCVMGAGIRPHDEASALAGTSRSSRCYTRGVCGNAAASRPRFKGRRLGATVHHTEAGSSTSMRHLSVPCRNSCVCVPNIMCPT